MTSELGNPMAGDYLNEIPPNASQQVQISTLNDVIRRLNTTLKTQTLSDGNNKRMLLGYQKDGWGSGKDFGIKISMVGIDVTAATNSQLLFKMDLATWYFYDPTTSKNFMQFGILPDGTGGEAVAASGFNVADAF